MSGSKCDHFYKSWALGFKHSIFPWFVFSKGKSNQLTSPHRSSPPNAHFAKREDCLRKVLLIRLAVLTVKVCGPLRSDSLLPSLFSWPLTSAHYLWASPLSPGLLLIWCSFAKVALPLTPSWEFTSLLSLSWAIHLKHSMSLFYALKIFLCVENRKITYKLAS